MLENREWYPLGTKQGVPIGNRVGEDHFLMILIICRANASVVKSGLSNGISFHCSISAANLLRIRLLQIQLVPYVISQRKKRESFPD